MSYVYSQFLKIYPRGIHRPLRSYNKRKEQGLEMSQVSRGLASKAGYVIQLCPPISCPGLSTKMKLRFPLHPTVDCGHLNFHCLSYLFTFG